MAALFIKLEQEAGSLREAARSIRKEGLEVILSKRSLTCLYRVWRRMVESNHGSTLKGESQQHLMALQRRGLIRLGEEGEYLITEIGKAVLTLAEAVDLVEEQ